MLDIPEVCSPMFQLFRPIRPILLSAALLIGSSTIAVPVASAEKDFDVTGSLD
jgi:hypothetical protein